MLLFLCSKQSESSRLKKALAGMKNEVDFEKKHYNIAGMGKKQVSTQTSRKPKTMNLYNNRFSCCYQDNTAKTSKVAIKFQQTSFTSHHVLKSSHYPVK